MVNKRNIDLAQQLLDRFFRDAEGRTNRQLDVYFTLQDLALPRDKSESALEFLTSRGLINTFGPDIAYLTDKGARAIIEDLDIASLPKELRDFVQKPIAPPVAEAPEVAPLEPSRAKRPPRAQLTHVDPDGGEHTLLLGKLCTIGRAPGNDIQVNDQRASKRHAELRWNNGTFELVDLGSANGTLLNGEYVDQQVLDHEDELVIGRTMLIFQAPEVIPTPIHENTTRMDQVPDAPPPLEPELPIEQPMERPVEKVERPARAQRPEPEPIKVVKGRPEPVREAPRAPSTMFDEEPRERPTDDLFSGGHAEPEDLFGGAEPIITDSAVPQLPASDLFAEGSDAGAALFDDGEGGGPDLLSREQERAPRDRDLFEDEGSKTADATPDDLFDGGDDDERTIGPGPVPSMVLDHLATDMAVEMEREPAEFDFAPIEPPDVSIDSPMSPDERTIIEPPSAGVISPDFEPASVDMGSFGTDAWEEETPADALMQNQPVLEDSIERIPSLAAMDLEEIEEPTPNGATVTMMRDELQPRKSEDLPRWGEDRPAPLGSHPEFAVAEHDGERLPVATPSLVNLKVPSKDELIAMSDRHRSPFHQTLAALRHHAERADLPDREALLGAIDILERHAYVRVALQLIERD